VRVSEPEPAGVADAEGYHRIVDGLVLVLVHSEPCIGIVIVHEGGVGQILVLRPVGGGDDGAAGVAQPLGEREDAVSVTSSAVGA
jgi:hypothetical protein